MKKCDTGNCGKSETVFFYRQRYVQERYTLIGTLQLKKIAFS